MKYFFFLNILNFLQGVNFSFFEKTLNFSVIFGKNLKTLWITMSPSPSFSLFLLTLTLCVCPNLNSRLSDQRLRPTLPGSRVTRREMQVGDPCMAEMEEKEKKTLKMQKYLELVV